MAQFVKQFYTEAASIPQQVMLPEEIEEARIIQEWLRSRRGGEKVEIFVPKEGQPQELVQMAAENAAETLAALRTQWQADTHKQEQALAELQSALQLPAPPNRIECYESPTPRAWPPWAPWWSSPAASPTRDCTGASTSRAGGGAPDDFASMEEMLTRRFRRWQAAQSVEAAPGRQAGRFVLLPARPVDRRRRQGTVGRAVDVLEKFALTGRVPVVGLAKQEEEIFFPHKSESAAAAAPLAGAVPGAAHP